MFLTAFRSNLMLSRDDGEKYNPASALIVADIKVYTIIKLFNHDNDYDLTFYHSLRTL
jgi:hypothetical protein